MRGVPHSFSSSSQLQSAVAAAALVSRPGKHAHVSHRSVQSSKVSSSGISGGRNVSGGSASSTAWKKQSSSNTGRLTSFTTLAQLWRLTSALSQIPVWSKNKSPEHTSAIPFSGGLEPREIFLILPTREEINTVLFGQGNPSLQFPKPLSHMHCYPE